jgi:hypothetical protein
MGESAAWTLAVRVLDVFITVMPLVAHSLVAHNDDGALQLQGLLPPRE